MQSSDKYNIDIKLLWKVVSQASPYKLTFIITALVGILLAPVAILRPFLVQTMVDDYIFHKDIQGLGTMALIFLGVLLLESTMRYVFTYTSNWLGQAVVRDLRTRVFNHITRLKISYFDKTPIGISTTQLNCSTGATF